MLDLIPSGLLATVGVIFAALIFIGFILARLYRRSSKEKFLLSAPALAVKR